MSTLSVTSMDSRNMSRPFDLAGPQTSLHVIAGGAPEDQARRLRRFREDHPDVDIVLRGPWEAVIPEPDGQRVIVRWDLAVLLDAVEARLAARDVASAGE